MHHGVAHFYAGRPAVDQQAPSLALQHRQQCPRLWQVVVIHVQGCGELTFQVLGHPAHLLDITALHHQRGGAEYFGLQVLIVQERLGLGHEQMGLALVRPGRWQALGGDVSVLGQGLQAGFVSAEDARCEHGLGRATREPLTGRLNKTVQSGALQGNHQARVGTELAGALGQRRDESFGQGFAPSFKRSRKQVHRVDRAHFRVHRDRLRACLRRLAQGNTATARPREAHGLDARVAHQCDTHLVTRAVEQ